MSGTNRVQCAGITIFDDSEVEFNEVFSVVLTTNSPATVTLNPSSAAVTILNDDVVNVEFQQSSLTVMESQSAVSVCAVIVEGAIARPVSVAFTTQDETAQGTYGIIFASINTCTAYCKN